jgi:hypothetical protein
MLIEQSAFAVLMVKPSHFGYDHDTASSNSFQKLLDLPTDEITKQVEIEFNAVVDGLRRHGITVIVAEDNGITPKPSAVFPNNWISTWPDGKVFIYPMATASRRIERNKDFLKLLGQDFNVTEIIDLSDFETKGSYLESTGSIVFDHRHKIAYCCLSARSTPALFKEHVASLGYQPVSFQAHSRGVAIYHTNVMMGIQSSTAVVCLSAIVDTDERTRVSELITTTGHQLVVINEAQLESYCGNVLELHNRQLERFLVMSQSAYDSFSNDQKASLERDKQLLPFAIPTIEALGGGSIRCMLTEIFLPLQVKSE